MSKNNSWFLISILTMLSIVSIGGGSIFASSSMNVGLTRFEAIPLDNAVRLEWDTETELETAGFMLKRGQNGSFDYLANPDASGSLFIISEGGPAIGSNYTYMDEAVVNGEIHTYQLIEAVADGSEVILAESTVTIGIVPTNTPIVLATGGGNGNGNNLATATESATLPATVFPSPTPQTNDPIVPSATPFPTSTPTKVATMVATMVRVTDEVSPDVEVEHQVASEPSFVDPNNESDDTDTANTGVAVAFAQEDPENYPGAETIEELPGDSFDNTGVDTIDEGQDSTGVGENPDLPDIIGTTPYPANPSPFNLDSELQDTETTQSSSSMAGKVYLWVAFIAAIVIFTAAVLGAILLYTRQRSKE